MFGVNLGLVTGAGHYATITCSTRRWASCSARWRRRPCLEKQSEFSFDFFWFLIFWVFHLSFPSFLFLIFSFYDLFFFGSFLFLIFSFYDLFFFRSFLFFDLFCFWYFLFLTCFTPFRFYISIEKVKASTWQTK